MKKVLLTLFVLAVSVICMPGAILRGKVVNADGEAEAYATVRLFTPADSVKAVALGVTAEVGDFSLDVPTAGKYRLIISSVGKKSIDREVDIASSVAELGTLTLEDAAAELGIVNVVATRPLVVKEIDRIGYDVQADEDSRTANLRDILRKVPMVTVEADGTIKVKGSSNFKVYKNGRPNNSFSSNAKEIFAALPASMIKKIEVITDPGAREDAEGVGAILNIVTTETTSMKGVMGSANASYDVLTNSPSANLWLTGTLDKVALSAHGGYFRQGEKAGSTTTISDYTYVNSGNRQTSRVTPRTRGDVFFWGVDGSYDIDSLNLVTLEFNGFAYDVDSWQTGDMAMYAPDGTKIYSYTANALVPKSGFLRFDGGLNYQHQTRRKGESLTLSYRVSNNSTTTQSEQTYDDRYNYPAPFTRSTTDQTLDFWEHTGQVDWTRPFREHHTLSVGGKFIYRLNTSDATMQYDDRAEKTDFSHVTTIAAAYADYRVNFGRFSGRAGLRYEFSHLGARYKQEGRPSFGSDLHDWVPNVSVMYNINDANSIKASYSTRINRPGINYLNPVRDETPTSVSSGNPDLKSIHYNQFSLNYSIIKQKFNLDVSASYEFANNSIASYTTVDENDYRTTTYGNVGDTRRLYFSIFGQWSITRKTSIMASISPGYNFLRIPNAENSRWNINTFFRVSQQLPWKLRVEGMLMYNTGSLIEAYGYNDNDAHSLMHVISLQRNFLKQDRLTVRLQAVNPFAFSDVYWHDVYNQGPYRGDTYTYMDTRRHFQVSVSYRFGTLRAQVKKVARGINNDDLTGGSSAPISTN